MTDQGAGLYLVDSSAWVPYLRPPLGQTPLRQRISSLLALNAVASTGMVRLELMRGTRNHQELTGLQRLLDGLHQLPTPEDLWEEAGRLGLQMRLAGIAAQATDLLIAAVAVRAGAVVLHRDRDFDRIARHTPLQVESHL